MAEKGTPLRGPGGEIKSYGLTYSDAICKEKNPVKYFLDPMAERFETKKTYGLIVNGRKVPTDELFEFDVPELEVKKAIVKAVKELNEFESIRYIPAYLEFAVKNNRDMERKIEELGKEIRKLKDELTEKETELKNKELSLSVDRLGRIEAINEQTRLLQKSAIAISAAAIAVTLIRLIAR